MGNRAVFQCDCGEFKVIDIPDDAEWVARERYDGPAPTLMDRILRRHKHYWRLRGVG